MQRSYEESRAFIDEELIAALFENLPGLLTDDEQEKLRECARLAMEQQSAAAQIGVEAARRHATTETEDRSRREAVGRYYMALLFQRAEAAAVEDMIEH
jgi:hypothetical protein